MRIICLHLWSLFAWVLECSILNFSNKFARLIFWVKWNDTNINMEYFVCVCVCVEKMYTFKLNQTKIEIILCSEIRMDRILSAWRNIRSSVPRLFKIRRVLHNRCVRLSPVEGLNQEGPVRINEVNVALRVRK